MLIGIFFQKSQPYLCTGGCVEVEASAGKIIYGQTLDRQDVNSDFLWHPCRTPLQSTKYIFKIAIMKFTIAALLVTSVAAFAPSSVEVCQHCPIVGELMWRTLTSCKEFLRNYCKVAPCEKGCLLPCCRT